MDDHSATDVRFTAGFWDERYRSATRVWSGAPNPQLVREAGDLAPGTALDAGCGEGADAHWLAARGWRVTAMDVSAVALERGAAHAGPDIAGRIGWECVDLTTWRPDDRTYDLVSAQFMQFPRAVREPLFARLAASVAPGGTLLVVGHDLSDLDTTAHRPHEPDLFFTAEQVAATLDPDRWDIQVAQARPRSAHDPSGDPITIADAVVRASRRRRPAHRGPPGAAAGRPRFAGVRAGVGWSSRTPPGRSSRAGVCSACAHLCKGY